MKIFDSGYCTNCKACESICPCNAIKIEDLYTNMTPIIDFQKCIKCNACKSVCQNNYLSNLNFRTPLKVYQGFRKDIKRLDSSSGGIASLLMEEFISKGGYVCSCLFENGEFVFKITNNIDMVKSFRGSKYVKSDVRKCYNDIRDLLHNKKVLFIGLPCQVAGLLLFLRGEHNNLVTIDLVCHGTPSMSTFNSFLQDNNINITDIKKIDFRRKTNFQLYINDESVGFNGIQDNYTISFLSGINYTENCYNCYYAKSQRISDLTLGDAWSSNIENDIKKNGISLILINTEKGMEIFDNLLVNVFELDYEKEKQINHQLMFPSNKHKNRDLYFRIMKNKGFNYATRKCLSKQYYKQKLKKVLICIGLIKRK